MAGRVRDTRTGQIHGDPGDLIQTCVSAAAGPVSLRPLGSAMPAASPASSRVWVPSATVSTVEASKTTGPPSPDLATPDDLAAACPDWRDRAAYACGPGSFLDDAERKTTGPPSPGGPGATGAAKRSTWR
jgi:hypothetical protein